MIFLICPEYCSKYILYYLYLSTTIYNLLQKNNSYNTGDNSVFLFFYYKKYSDI